VDLGDGYDETDPFVDNTEAVCIVSLHWLHGVKCLLLQLWCSWTCHCELCNLRFI